MAEEYDAGNQAHVGKRKKIKDEYDARVQIGFREVLQSPNGRCWLWDFISKLPSRVDRYKSDVANLAYDAARADIYNEWLAFLQTTENAPLFNKMIEERNLWQMKLQK